MKKTRLKLKKQVWLVLIIIVISLIALKIGLNIYHDYQYHQTDEYKLLEKGYSLEEIKLLQNSLKPNTFKDLVNTPKNEFLLSLFKEPYYLQKNLNDYLAYEKIHPEYSPTQIITYINTHNDKEHYEYSLPADLTKDNLILVNKYYELTEEYQPDDLVNISRDYYYGENHQIRKVAYEAFKKMWEEAQKEDIYLIINSSFRDYKSQKTTYDNYKDQKGTTYADSVAARPGFSEHQTGLALDIFSKTNLSTATFKNSPTHLWLQNNAYKFGFIERYPEGKENITGFSAEPWHYRYVGIEAATYIHENNITFDEYYAYFVEK